MSSAVMVWRETDESGYAVADWDAFCDEFGIVHSPATVGGHVWYRRGVECTWGNPRPAGAALGDVHRVTFATFHAGASIPDVAALAFEWWQRHGGNMYADAEVRARMVLA